LIAFKNSQQVWENPYYGTRSLVCIRDRVVIVFDKLHDLFGVASLTVSGMFCINGTPPVAMAPTSLVRVAL
jgi:hypothetical protein